MVPGDWRLSFVPMEEEKQEKNRYICYREILTPMKSQFLQCAAEFQKQQR